MIHAFLKDSDVEVLASFKNIDKTEIERLRSKPVYASAFDYI